MIAYLYIFLGGGIGALLRGVFSIFCTSQIKELEKYYYLPTLVVNLLGCFLLGYFAKKFQAEDTHLRHLFCVGFCGGLTTFSTFGFEALKLFKSQRLPEGLIYIGISIIVGILFAYWGFRKA